MASVKGTAGSTWPYSSSRRWQLFVYRKYAGQEPRWYEVFTGPVYLWRAIKWILHQRAVCCNYQPFYLLDIPTGVKHPVPKFWGMV